MNTLKQIKRKAIVKIAMLLAIVLIVCCSNDDSTAPGPDGGDVALELKTVSSFDAFESQLPESITLDNSGNIYVSMSPLREIWKLNPAGIFQEVIASFSLEPGLLGVSGLKFDAKGNLYVAIYSTLPDMIGVWKIKPNGEKERIPGTGNILLPNDLVFSSDGTLYITDSLMGAVWRYESDGVAELWVHDESLEGTGAFGLGFPLGANGIVVTQEKKAPMGYSHAEQLKGGIIVANTEKAQLLYIPILSNGSAGSPMIMIADPETLFGLDGITMDGEGTIYGAVNFGHKIVRISSDGGNLSDVANGAPLDFPTSLAFGSGSESTTLFITNFGAIHFLSDPPMPGEANPAVISMRLGF